MNFPTKAKAVVYSALLFAAGMLTGVVLSLAVARSFMFHPPAAHDMAKKMMHHLQWKLSLSPEQSAQIEPIVERTAQSLQAIHRETMERVAATMKAAHGEVATHLTPEQQKKLGEMEARRRSLFHGDGAMPPPP
jgi:Spy/CpxP family protein refolding chaperone